MYDSAFAAINEHGGVDYAPHNKGITPVFRMASVIHPAESEKAGRPIHFDQEQYSLFIAGDATSVSTGIVDDAIRARFEEAYEKWKRKDHRHISGTPLAVWPPATPSFIKEMEYHNVFSVDDLAAIADVNLDRIQEGRMWRDKAKAWLDSAKGGAETARYAAENARLRDDIAEINAKLAALTGEPVEKRAKRKVSPERRAQLVQQLAAAREKRAAQ